MVCNIRFIDVCTEHLPRNRHFIGNMIYIELGGCNRAKLWCEETGVNVEIINAVRGKVDGVFIPFSSCFAHSTLYPGSTPFFQHITKNGTEWNFEREYPNALPCTSDYIAISAVIFRYLQLWE